MSKQLRPWSLAAASIAVAASFAVPTTPALAAPSCFGEKATIVGTDGDDTIHGTPHADVIVTGDGNDTVYGEGGNDRICAQSSQPNPVIKHLYGGPGADRIQGSPRNNFIYGGRGDDHLYGGYEGNTFYDGPGDDYVGGGESLDYFHAGPGDDVMLGGNTRISPTPDDEVFYDKSPRPVIIDLQADTATGYGHDIVKHIWRATGSRYDDVMRGTPRDDELNGGCGDDHLYGYGGDDQFSGGQGCPDSDIDIERGGANHDSLLGSTDGTRKDHFYGEGGKDTFYNNGGREHFSGGAGSDLFKVARNAPEDAALQIDLASGAYNIGGRTGIVRNVERVEGSDRDDLIYGNNKANDLYGGPGSDDLHGRGGKDLLIGDYTGSDPADRAYGGPGTDRCEATVEHSCEE